MSVVRMSLLSAAIKFTNEGGVTLSLRAAQPTEQDLARVKKGSGSVDGVHMSPIGLLPTNVKKSTLEFPESSSPPLEQSLSDAHHDRHDSDPAELRNPQVIIELDVCDTGVGIAPENISKLFQPYSQATRSTQREHGGTGLGLSICTEIVKNFSGSIFVTSELGVGSIFHTRLLMEVCDDESIRRGLGNGSGSYSDSPDLRLAAVKETKRAAKAKAERILIVDDHDVNCKLLARMVTSMDFTCDVAHDGLEAIDALKINMSTTREKLMQKGVVDPTPSVSYLCVFLDLNMPNLDGWGCLAQIRGALGLSTLPVIALTAESLDPARALDAGFTLSLSKPFRKPALQAILEPIVEAKQLEARRSGVQSTSPPASDTEKSSNHSSPEAVEERATVPTTKSPTQFMRRPTPRQGTHRVSASNPTELSSPLLPSLPCADDGLRLPSSPRIPVNHALVSSALSTLHHATREESCKCSADSPEHVSAPRRLSPVQPLNLFAQPNSASSTPQHHMARSMELHGMSSGSIGDGTASDAGDPVASVHLRGSSDFQPTGSSSPPLRPSSRQLQAQHSSPASRTASVDCTPSSHRRSLRDAESDSSDSLSVSPLHPYATLKGLVGGVPSRLRGGGAHSPLGLTASPRTVSRHLVIEPTSYPVIRRSGSCTPITNASMNSITDSIVPIAVRRNGHTAAAAAFNSDNEDTRRRRWPHRKMEVDESAQTVPASIPPLHPVPATPVRSSSPTPSPSPAASLSPSATPSLASTTSTRSEESSSGSQPSNSGSDSSGSSSSGRGSSARCKKRTQTRSKKGACVTLQYMNPSCAPSVTTGGDIVDLTPLRSMLSHRSSSDTIGVLSGLTSSADTTDSRSESGSGSGRGSGSSSSSSSPFCTPRRATHQVEPLSAGVIRDHTRAQRLRSVVLNAMNLELPRSRPAHVVMSPPPLLAPPCTPSSPLNPDAVQYPPLTTTHYVPAAYPKPFPLHVFKGASRR
jgi:CheY-like chemotaxis protein